MGTTTSFDRSTKHTGAVGDVVEFDVDGRFGYGIATAFHEAYGTVLHVLRGTYASRPSAFDFLVNVERSIVAFFPLRAARRRKVVRVVGRVALRQKIAWLPVFRTQFNMPLGDDWSLWDGKRQWPVGKLSDEEKERYPLLMVVNDGFVEHVLRTNEVPFDDE